MMKIAAISDIHGNLAALKAVLAEIKGHAPDLIVNLGDSLSGPLFPAECADCLLSLDIPTIRGNHERQLLTLPVDEMGESDRYAMSCLETHHLRWIEHTPTTLLIEREIQLVHGTPESDLGYFLETVEPQGVREANRLEIHDRAHGVSAPLILCGHTHISRTVSLGDGRLVVNPGSVGLPAYEDDRSLPSQNADWIAARPVRTRGETQRFLVSRIEFGHLRLGEGCEAGREPWTSGLG